MHIPYYKLLVAFLFVASTAYVHFRGQNRLGFWRQLSDHSTFMAPINCFMYLFSKVPCTPFLKAEHFPELKLLDAHWEEIRDEALKLARSGSIRKSDKFDDLGFNSFFKTGWSRFYLMWYGQDHMSAALTCPVTVKLLKQIPGIKAAMFASLPPGGTLVRHRDPFAGSLRYHLGLVTPGTPNCFIDVDGQRHIWRDGESVVFDETYLHYAENKSDQTRVVLFCDVERPLHSPLARKINRLVSRHLIGAASSPNDASDKTGGLNKAFKYVQAVRLLGKKIKARSRFWYYVLKWAIMGGPIVWWLVA